MNQTTSDLPKLGAPAHRALDAAGIQRLDQLTQFSEAEIKRLHGIGPHAIEQLRRALAAKGLSFAADPIAKQ
jgi:DNA-directed RNA polymerase alpha subunit